jgi:hypothetical protein
MQAQSQRSTPDRPDLCCTYHVVTKLYETAKCDPGNSPAKGSLACHVGKCPDRQIVFRIAYKISPVELGMSAPRHIGRI